MLQTSDSRELAVGVCRRDMFFCSFEGLGFRLRFFVNAGF